MSRLRNALLCLLLAASAALVLYLTILVHHADQILTQVPIELTGVSALLERSADQVTAEAVQTRRDAMARLDQALTTISQAQADFDRQMTQTNETVASAQRDLGQLARQLGDAGVQIGQAASAIDLSVQEVAKVRQDIAPAIAGLNLLMQRNALPAELLGTLGAAKVTAGETAQTMRTVRDAMPQILMGVDKVVENSDHATAASAQAAEQTTNVMRNFAAASKPLPLPLRIFLQVAPPLAGFAAGAATTYQATH